MAEPKENPPAGNTVVYSYGGQYDPRTKTLSNLNMQPRETAGTEERVSRSGRPRGSTREKTESSMREKYSTLKKENSALKKRIKELEAQNNRYRLAMAKLSQVFAAIESEVQEG